MKKEIEKDIDLDLILFFPMLKEMRNLVNL